VFAEEDLEKIELSHSGFKAVKDIYAITVLAEGCMHQGQEQNMARGGRPPVEAGYLIV